MGNLNPRLQRSESSSLSKDINKHLREARRQEFHPDVKKFLILGPGSSGKSTIFKQVKALHGIELSDPEKDQHKESILLNLVLDMKLLVRKSKELPCRDPSKFAHCAMDLENDPKLKDAVQTLEYFEENIRPTPRVIQAIKYLWKTKPIQATWNERIYFSILDSSAYFLDDIDRVTDPNFEPVYDDYLRTCVHTSGIVQTSFTLESFSFHFFDVGGQRTERKKWIFCFDNITALLFVVGLNSYCEVLFENDSQNSMRESLELFEELLTGSWFHRTQIVLFLNKTDLFRKRLKEGKSLKICFPEYDGPEFNKSNDNDEKEFEAVYNECLSYIQDKYMEKNKLKRRLLSVHTLCAFDRENVRTVFEDVQRIIIQTTLFRDILV